MKLIDLIKCIAFIIGSYILYNILQICNARVADSTL